MNTAVNIGPEPKPFCAECGGTHEITGARMDCIRFWKLYALKLENKIAVDRILVDGCANCNGSGFVEDKIHCESCLGTGRESIALLDWAVVLLSSATPSKLLDDRKSVQWCQQFGKWFAATQEKLNRIRP